MRPPVTRMTLICFFLWISLPATASQSCSVREDDNASAPLREDKGTAQLLDRLKTDSDFTLQEAAQRLEGVDTTTREKAVGHLRWSISRGENKLNAYYLLTAMGVAGRADVADQFLVGLNDPDPLVRVESINGLMAAPSSKKIEAGRALLDRLPVEIRTTTGDAGVFHGLLRAVAKISGPELLSKAGALKDLLKAERHGSESREAEVFKEEKLLIAAALIRILGPEGAVREFEGLDISKPWEQSATAAAVDSLASFGQGEFEDMEKAARDRLKDQFRRYGIGLLSQADSSEAAERQADFRGATLRLLATVLGPPRDWRDDDLALIPNAMEAALAVEPQGSEIAKGINFLLPQLRAEQQKRQRERRQR